MEPLAHHVRERLRGAADAEFGRGQRRFFRHEVETWGVRTRELHSIARELYREVKDWPEARRNALGTEFLQSGKLEEGALVCYVYRRLARQFAVREFRLFEGWIDRYVDNWATCDGISSWLLSACIANEPGLMRELPAWTASPNRWRRRASAVALLQEAKRGRNTAVILDIAGRLIADPDDMVQKGVGWMLKETYPKQPEPVVAFLREHGDAPRLLLRYAAEKMTAEDRTLVLSRAQERRATAPRSARSPRHQP